jgi:hypothetical protein
MALDADLLVREADRLVERTGRQLAEYSSRMERRDRGARAARTLVRRLRLRLQRLELYRAFVRSSPNAHTALLPEFLEASGLLPRHKRRRRQ